MTHTNPADPKWRQWRADFYGVQPVVHPYGKRTVRKVPAYGELAITPSKASRFGKFFGRA